MKRLWKWIVFQWNTFYNYYYFLLKRKEADRLHATTGKRYHVVPGGGKRGLIIVDNTFVKLYNQGMPKAKRITINELLRMSYYSTSVTSITRKE